jgi:molecular chaperone DnaK
MPYVLGIHLGNTATSAAVARRDGGQWGAAAPFPLDSGSATVPTVLCKVQDGSFVAGVPAQRQELTHHEWVVRGFERYLGDDAPMVVGSEFVHTQRLVAIMIEWVADLVAQRQGHPPEHIAVAHSGTWGPYRTHLVHQELTQRGLTDVTLLPAPLAVGLDYASRQRVEDNGTLAVGYVGGSGCDATVLRRRKQGFELVTPSLDTDHPGGQDLDDEIFRHLRAQLGEQLDGLDPTDVRDRTMLARLRAECTRVKESLSHQPESSIRVELPQVRTELPLSRSHYEKLAQAHLERVPELLLQAVQSATLTTEQLDAVVLAGGTMRTPLLKQLVSQRLQRPAQVDVAPELVAARGAAVSAVQVLSTDTDQAASSQETSVLMRIEGSREFDYLDDEEPEAAVPRPPVQVEPMYLEPVDERRRRMFQILKLSIAALLILGGLVMTLQHEGFFGDPHNSLPGVLQKH